jgi:ATP-dependent protease Clp ATPase subunit
MSELRVGMRVDQRLSRMGDFLKTLEPGAVAGRVKGRVLGQDEWVDSIARFAYQQAFRGYLLDSGEDPAGLPNLGVMLGMGPTASGKTFAVKSYCEETGIRCIYQSCATLTGSGWNGEDLDETLARAAAAQEEADGLPVMVVFDEADKLRMDERSDHQSFNAMKDFLAPLDGGIYHGQADSHCPSFDVDMDLLVIVFLGAFTGIEDIVRRRLAGRGSFGLVSAGDGADASGLDVAGLRSQVTIQDLIEWGLMPEFCGRIGDIRNIPAIGEETLAHIARSVAGRCANVMPRGCGFGITSAAATLLARLAVRSGLGARFVNTTLNGLHAEALARAASDWGIVRAVVRVSGGELVLRYERGDGRDEHDEVAMRPDQLGDIAAELVRPGMDSSFSGRVDSLVGQYGLERINECGEVETAARLVVRLSPRYAGEGEVTEGARTLMATLLRYVYGFYGHESGKNYCTMSVVVSLLGLAYREDPTQSLSPLDVLIEGTDEANGFQGLSETLRIREGKGLEASPELESVLGRYQEFSKLPVKVQDASTDVCLCSFASLFTAEGNQELADVLGLLVS